jgi:arylsulfatase A-like enzyme
VLAARTASSHLRAYVPGGESRGEAWDEELQELDCRGMQGPRVSSSERLTRRSAIKRGLIAASGVAVGEWLARQEDVAEASVAMARSHGAPNILVILVDQLRTPQWFQNGAIAAGMMPNLARLRRGGIYFASHYTAANDCSPARAALLTGLHSQQTGCLVTSASTLDPDFPTWGSILREHGYETYWYGKWHLTRGDYAWTQADIGALEPYGFSGGTYPSPDGSPGEGWLVDPLIVRQFRDWYATAPRTKPWCTTVSLVNPHDITWWYRWSRHVASEKHARRIVGGLPPNFETPNQMFARSKPRLQHSLQQTAQISFGRVPYSGRNVERMWLPFTDLYLKLLHRVDVQIGQVLDTLHSKPQIAANTVVIFTSDHGEYGASHGMRGKGASAYEEALRVPLIVKDLRGAFSAAHSKTRTALTSSVDVVPLLLTIATGSNAWRREARYSHIARRHDLARMLVDPRAPGRPYVVHCTDELVTEFAVKLYSSKAPLHVTAIRTPHGKYATYSNWRPSTNTILTAGQESELYDYSTHGGRLEIDNRSGRSKLEPRLRSQLEEAVRYELRAPVPAYLRSAQQNGYADYYKSAQAAVIEATALRRKIDASAPPAKATERFGPAGQI